MIRISKIPTFARCEKFAMSERPEEVYWGVAAYVGTWAHSLLTGQSFDRRQAISFDEITRSIPEAEQQAQRLNLVARGLLDEYDLEIVEREVVVSDSIGDLEISGHIDLLCRRRRDQSAVLVDLKTGRSLTSEWLQLAAYGMAARRMGARDLDEAAIIAVPRTPLHKPQLGHLVFQRLDDIIEESRPLMKRIGEVALGTREPLRMPGSHCTLCAEQCAVRAPSWPQQPARQQQPRGDQK